ncbi:MAG: glycosyltransferase [Verrucomicrobiae bacterium]|nr:glycosyltransferase [Verrucomicrobiae bacterium]
MNILFVHHGAISANSMNHISPFAEELRQMDHEVVIAVPEFDPTFVYFPYSQLTLLPYETILEKPHCFQGEPPDIVHAWTPREIVRRFCEQLWQKIDAHWIIHLEDDEVAVRQSAEHLTEEDLLHRTDPLHGPWFINQADAFTVILEDLQKNLPKNKPVLTLYPGFDLRAAKRNPEKPLSKADFAIPEEFKVITYPGASSGVNAEDLQDLYKAVDLLNQHGTPVILLKTGIPDTKLRQNIPENANTWIRDVGFFLRNQLWRLVELADIVVQPGRINPYNENRLPSKIPDFLCLGKPLVTTMANVGSHLQDGENALLLKTSSPEEIAARCQELFSKPQFAEKIAKKGQEIGLEWFNLSKNTKALLAFYEEILARPCHPHAIARGSQIEIALESFERKLTKIKTPDRETEELQDYLLNYRKHPVEKESAASPIPPAQIECQVFYPHEPTFMDPASLRRWYVKGPMRRFLFPFTPNHEMEWVRIDPGQFPGTYMIKNWSILNAAQEPLFQWTPDSTKSVTCQPHGATLGPSTAEGIEIWSLTHDPQLLFAPLPPIRRDEIRWFQIEMRATEIESPLTKKLKLKRKPDVEEEAREQALLAKIDTLLATYQRRRSPMLRMVDHFRKR